MLINLNSLYEWNKNLKFIKSTIQYKTPFLNTKYADYSISAKISLYMGSNQ